MPSSAMKLVKEEPLGSKEDLRLRFALYHFQGSFADKRAFGREPTHLDNCI